MTSSNPDKKLNLFGLIMFAAGVWTFSKGGVEGGEEIDIFVFALFWTFVKEKCYIL